MQRGMRIATRTPSTSSDVQFPFPFFIELAGTGTGTTSICLLTSPSKSVSMLTRMKAAFALPPSRHHFKPGPFPKIYLLWGAPRTPPPGSSNKRFRSWLALRSRSNLSRSASLGSNARLSPPTRMPESGHLQSASRYPIVEIVTDAGQSRTTQTFHASAPCRRAHTRLGGKYRQNFFDVLADGAGRGRSILCHHSAASSIWARACGETLISSGGVNRTGEAAPRAAPRK